jgi:hypothetical protein
VCPDVIAPITLLQYVAAGLPLYDGFTTVKPIKSQMYGEIMLIAEELFSTKTFFNFPL